MTNIQTDESSYERPNNTESREAFDVNVGSYLRKLKRRWIPAMGAFLLTVGAAAFMSTLLEEIYKAEGKILFKQNPINTLAGLEAGTRELNSLLNDQTPLNTEELRIISEPVLQQTIDQLKLEDDEGQPLETEALKQGLDVDIVGGTDVISIAYSHQDPYKAAKVVNTLMDAYIQQQVRSNQADTVNADSFINNQIPKVETKLKDVESSLQQFYEKNQVVDLQEEKRTLVSDLGTFNRQISTTGAQLQGTQAQASSLQKQLGLNLRQAIAANQLGSTPAVQSILGELTNTETQLAQERQRFNDNHPSVQSLLEKKGYLKQQLQQLIGQYVGTGVSEGLLQSGNPRGNQLEKFINLKIEELSLQTQLSSLYNYQKAYLDRAKQLPRLEKREQELLREVETARKTYATLLDNQQQLQLLVNQTTGNAEVIELARVP